MNDFNTKYVLFGTGDYYKRYKLWLEQRNVVALLDNSVLKQDTYINGVPVISPQKINSIAYDVVVIMSFYVDEMREQLIKLGVEKEKIYHFYDLHDLFQKENPSFFNEQVKKILLMSHDLALGGPSIALFNAAKVLKKQGYDVYLASMINGELSDAITKEGIPLIIDRRLQISTMNEIPWINKSYDLIVCNTINYHVFLSDRDTSTPVIWWLHDARRYYDGIKKERLENLNIKNMKILSVGPVPANAINEFLPDIHIESLLYGVIENE